MNHRTIIGAFVLAALLPPLQAQISLFDHTPDARFAAMGKTGADGRGTGSWLINPALGWTRDIRAAYQTRSLNWLDPEGTSRAFTVGLPVATDYSVEGYYLPLSVPGPFRTPSFDQEYYGIGISRMLIPDRLMAGISIKRLMINMGVDISATLGDAGLVAIFPFDEEVSGGSELIAGAAITNVGSDLKRAGVTYGKAQQFLHLHAAFETHTDLAGIISGLTVSAVFTRILNYWIDDWRDFWGFGVEIGSMDILFLRAGATIQPYDFIFGRANEPSFPLGAGLRLPLDRIIPVGRRIVLTFDYASVPLVQAWGVNPYSSPSRNTALSFGVEVMGKE